MKMIKYFIFTGHIQFLVSSIINLNFNPKAHHTGNTLVNVYVALPVITPVVGSSNAHFMGQIGGPQYVNLEFGRYFHFCWCYYYIEKYVACQRDFRIQSFLSIRQVHGDLCKHLGIDSSTDSEGMSVLLMFC